MDRPIHELRALTVGELREAIKDLPDSAAILIDDRGWHLDPFQFLAIGTCTDDPGLVIKAMNLRAVHYDV
jgi:hypothetical protein